MSQVTQRRPLWLLIHMFFVAEIICWSRSRDLQSAVKIQPLLEFLLVLRLSKKSGWQNLGKERDLLLAEQPDFQKNLKNAHTTYFFWKVFKILRQVNKILANLTILVNLVNVVKD